MYSTEQPQNSFLDTKMDSSSIDLSGSKIFLVDDTPANLKVLRQALEPEGYSILIATNGEASLAPCPPAA